MAVRVLVVDDDDEIRQALMEVLVDEGYDALGAADGRDAWSVLEQTTVRVILLDLMMPVMNGWQLLAKLRGDPRYQHTPVIVMTAGSRADHIDAQAVLKKPLDIARVFSTVEHAAHAA